MKRYVAFCMLIVMCLSVFSCGRMPEDGRTWSEPYRVDLLSDTTSFRTSVPTYMIDFTTGDFGSLLNDYHEVDYDPGRGYSSFTVTGNDPYLNLKVPKTKISNMTFVLLCYRTSYSGKGAFRITHSEDRASTLTEAFRWQASEEWSTAVIPMSAWQSLPEGATFSKLMMALVHGASVEGTSFDLKYMGFFKTEEDANAFDYAEYLKKLAYDAEHPNENPDEGEQVDWPDPTYREMETTAEDNVPSSLQYTVSEDGSAVTISYAVNGETVSYTVPNDKDYLYGGYAATDDVGRTLFNSSQVGVYGHDRQVGLFYFLCHQEFEDHGAVYDLQKIIDDLGVEAAGKLDCGLYGPRGSCHWFAEPLYGYYYINDVWVLRKHVELLTNAGIDFLYFDVTNALTYRQTAITLMSILHEYNEQGFDAPQVVFYTNTKADAVVKEYYDHIYKIGLYEDTWYRIDGKPVIVVPEGTTNIDNFFTFRTTQWPNPSNKVHKDNAWPWMDFSWPQRVYNDLDGNPHAINVSVAQHSGSIRFSLSSLYGDSSNRGRSFTALEGSAWVYGERANREYTRSLTTAYKAWQENEELTKLGLNFQAQWDYAIASEADTILVTAWNEWVAPRLESPDTEVNFIDCASMEFSRDCEMMRGGYFDNYYMQLIYNVQRAKGTAPVVVQDGRKAINVTGSFDQWSDVLVTYYDASGDTIDRDNLGFAYTQYTNTSGRNDIVESKVTSDTKNLYFYVKTVNDISMFDTNSSWMQLYLNVDGVDGEGKESGWYGYDFIVNHKAKDAFTTTVARYNGTDGKYGFESVGEVSYRVKDNEMMIAVPLSKLGIEGYQEICVQFKWADSETVYDEMEDFYCDGDMAPLGRLNYVYQNYIPGVSENTDPEPETESALDTETQGEVSQTTTTPTDSDTLSENTGKKGCRSTMCGSMLLPVITLMSAAPLLSKKHRIAGFTK